MRNHSRIISLFVCLALLCGCSVGQAAAPAQSPVATSTPEPTATLLPSATPTAAPTATPTLTPTPQPGVWLHPALEPALSEPLKAAIKDIGGTVAASPKGASAVVSPAAEASLAAWYYAPVVPFPTLTDEISMDDFLAFWAGEAGALGLLTDDGSSPTLYVSSETLAALQALFGAPDEKTPVQIASADAIIDLAWNARPNAWAIVPFDTLETRWKVLRIDGMSLLDKELDAESWPLTLRLGIDGPKAEELLKAAQNQVPRTNRDTDEMTVLMMTGVTAMVRSIAYRMETKGILYPAQLISATLASADITHISNEIPFYSQCPYPDPVQQDLVFCSSPRYIDLLRAVGTDVVELTGNHFQDYGDEATLETLNMYKAEGWPHYGGGSDLQDATRAITLTSNSNTLSFIGCNPVGPEYAWATDEHPGAAPCNWDLMYSELKKMAKEVDVPIATFQYDEIYEYEATPQQKEDFRSMVDAGALIVSGSQAHHPQAIEFYKGAFIHYGLGNLFFDQMQELGTRQEFVDRHVIYKGRHISTELLTFMLEDYAQPRPMTPEERSEALQAVFTASGW